jgi:predicted Zn finger-like uncharacterized protein
MLLVIRCPKCRAASRVEEEDLGLTVQCPRCADTFAAVEEAELVAPGPRAAAAAAPELPDPPDPFPDPFEPEPPPGPTPEPEPAAHPDAEFDPHREPPGSLPASVLVGLALLPFLIPILWVVAPAVIGVEPVLSLASALALAVSASVLCLAVIYTVDWRPRTRIRGVLLLVVLSYVTGVTLYLLKKEWVDRVRRFFGVNPTWTKFEPVGAGYRVEWPGPSEEYKDAPPSSLVVLACHKVSRGGVGMGKDDSFVVGSSLELTPRPGEQPGDDAWFERLAADVAAQSRGTLRGQAEKVTSRGPGAAPGRQVVIDLKGTTRVAQVFCLSWKDGRGTPKYRVYYAAIEGVGMSPDDRAAMAFFGSFVVTDPPK